MKLSVVIPTYNAQRYLPKLLKKLKDQSLSFELIAIDSSSSDQTPQLLASHADQIITIAQNEFDHGGTRTKAAKAAHGDIIIFLTQDALPADDNTLETLIRAFDDPTVGAVFGRQLPYEETSLFGKHLRSFNYPAHSYTRTFADRERYGIKTAFFSDSFSAYRKEVLAEVGWFKDGLIVGEDMHIAARILQAGYTIAYCAEAKVYHSHSYTVTEEFKRYFDTGVFHASEAWLIETFGSAGGEGKRYLQSEFQYLLQQHAYTKIPEFFVRSTMKFAGYTLGKRFRKLPRWLIHRCSMHPAWWKTYYLSK